jgi:hypothetical protein
MAADGTITIDTRVDPSGFDKGVGKMADGAKAKMGDTLDDIDSGVKGMGGEIAAGILGGIVPGADKIVGLLKGAAGLGPAFVAVLVTVGAIAAVLVVIPLLVFAIINSIVMLSALLVKMGVEAYKFTENLVNGMFAAMDRSQGYSKQLATIKQMFDSVKQASYAMWAPLLEFATPYIQQVTDLLIRMFNVIAMIIAALLHQSKVWQYVAGSTKKAGDAAKGALAPFDQLQVLQQGMPGMNAGAGAFTLVDVDPDILKKVWSGIVAWFQENVITPLGTFFSSLWDTVKEGAQAGWDKVVEVWGIVKEWFLEHVWGPIADATNLDEAFAQLGVALQGLWDVIVQGWDWLVLKLGGFFEFIGQAVKATLPAMWTMFKEGVKNVVAFVGDLFTSLWQTIAGVVAGIVEVLAGIVTFITAVLTGDTGKALEGLKMVFYGVFDAIISVVEGAVNIIIDFMNLLIRSLETMVNGIVDALNAISIDIPAAWWHPALHLSFNLSHVDLREIGKVSIPRFLPNVTGFAGGGTGGLAVALASGAVIPPNSRFAAILGDQTSGRNLEAPEELIRQIVREESGGNIAIKFEGTLASLVEVLKPVIDRENTRIGASLISGVTI